MWAFRRNPIKKMGIQYSKTSGMLYNAWISHNRKKHWIPHFLNFTLIYWIFKDSVHLWIYVNFISLLPLILEIYLIYACCWCLAKIWEWLLTFIQYLSPTAEACVLKQKQVIKVKACTVSASQWHLSTSNHWKFTAVEGVHSLKCSGMAPVDVFLQATFLYTQTTQVGFKYLL